MVQKAADISLHRIAVLRAIAPIEIHNPALLHTLLDTKVEHRLLLAIVDARHTAIIALLVVSLDLLDHLGRNILHRHLSVIIKELLAIDKNLLDRLAIDLDRAVIAHLDPRQLLHQLLKHRPLRHPESISIVDKRISLHLDLRKTLHHESLLHQARILAERNRTQILRLRQRDVAQVRLVADIADTQDIAAHLDSRDTEYTVIHRRSARHLRTILRIEQNSSRPDERLVAALFDNLAREHHLLRQSKRRHA